MVPDPPTRTRGRSLTMSCRLSDSLILLATFSSSTTSWIFVEEGELCAKDVVLQRILPSAIAWGLQQLMLSAIECSLSVFFLRDAQEPQISTSTLTVPDAKKSSNMSTNAMEEDVPLKWQR